MESEATFRIIRVTRIHEQQRIAEETAFRYQKVLHIVNTISQAHFGEAANLTVPRKWTLLFRQSNLVKHTPMIYN